MVFIWYLYGILMVFTPYPERSFLESKLGEN